jgi:hypothetical protein
MKSNTKTISIFFITLAILSVASFVYGTRYIEGLISRATELKGDIEKLQVKVGHLKALHQAAQDTNDDKAKINSYIVQAGGSVPFITELENLASNIGLDYNTDRIETKSAPDIDLQGKELLSISFTASGPWSSVFKFIKLVESMPYSINIQKIDLFASVADKKVVIDVGTTSTTTATRVSVKENNWKAVILFDVVKNKEN